MGVVNVQESWSGEEAGDQFDGVTSRSSSRRRFTVLCDSPDDDPTTALEAAGVPRIGDAHPKWTWQAAVQRRANPIGPFLFEVIVDYAGQDSPLTAPKEESWSFAQSNEPIDRDADGNAIKNPVGDPYVGITKEFFDPVYTVTRNEASYPLSTALAYQGAVNSDDFMGASPGQARLIEISGQKVVAAETYWRVTYKFQFRADGWKLRVLCEGKRYWTGKYKNGKKVILNAVDANKEPVSNPVRLDAQGRLLDEGDADVWQEFKIYPELPFSALGL